MHMYIQMYYVKFHQNPLSGLGGHAPTRHGQTGRQTDRRKNRETGGGRGGIKISTSHSDKNKAKVGP